MARKRARLVGATIGALLLGGGLLGVTSAGAGQPDSASPTVEAVTSGVTGAMGPTAKKAGFYRAAKGPANRALRALRVSYPNEEKYQQAPRSCFNVQQARNARGWFMVNVWNQAPSGRDCSSWFGFNALVKLESRRQATQVAIGSPLDWFWECSDIERKVRRAGGPMSVMKDVRAGSEFQGRLQPLCTDL